MISSFDRKCFIFISLPEFGDYSVGWKSEENRGKRKHESNSRRRWSFTVAGGRNRNPPHVTSIKVGLMVCSRCFRLHDTRILRRQFWRVLFVHLQWHVFSHTLTILHHLSRKTCMATIQTRDAYWPYYTLVYSFILHTIFVYDDVCHL